MKKFFSTIITFVLLSNTLFFSFSENTFALETDWNASNWTYEKARHLASKVLFAPRKDIVDELFQAGSASSAVDILFPSEDWPDRTTFNQTLFDSWLYDSNSFDNWTTNMRKYYMYKKYLDPYEAKAKLFLIFEDIFSVDYRNNSIEFSDIEKTHDVIYNDIFWDWWYKQLVKDVVFWTDWSYALWEYLDFFNLNKDYPNENYSRELIQLFMMWIFKPYDNQNTPDLVKNYSEDDVAALAKILTWFTFDEWNHQVSYNTWTDKYWHNTKWNWDLDWDWVEWDVIFLDWDLKSWDENKFPFYNSWSWTINVNEIVNPITYNWVQNNWLADNTIDYIFSKRWYEIALFLADKFFRFYANMEPTQEEMEDLADIFYANDFKIFPTIKTFLASDVIYSDKSMNSIHYKNPIELWLWTFKIINETPAFWDLDEVNYGLLSDLWWTPYNPVTIFWRDWYEENDEFYNAYYHDKWMTYSTKIFYKNDNFDLKNFVTDEKINETWSIIFSTSTWNTFEWNISLDEISLNLTWAVVWSGWIITENEICTWSVKFAPWNFNFPNLDISTSSWWVLWNISIWTWAINISENFLEISTWSLVYSWSTCEILSWTWNITIWASLTRDFTVEEFFSSIEEKIYLWKKTPEEVKNSLKNFLTTNENWEKISFDVTDSNFRTKKIIPVISILLAQPEFVMISWNDWENISENSWASSFQWKDEKLIIVNLWWGYDWLNWIIPKAEYNTTYQDFRKKENNWEIISDIRIPLNQLIDLNPDSEDWFYMNDALSAFKPLYDNWDLKIINRVWISNHSRWHDVATTQLTSSDWKAVYAESEWLIWRLSKYEENSLRNIAIWITPHVYRWWKYVRIWWSWLKIYPYWSYSTEQRNDVISGFTWWILSRNYPWNSENIFKWALDLHTVWDVAKNSSLNRDWAWYWISDNLDFIKIAMENWVWSTYYIRWPRGYDTHKDELKIDSNSPEWYLNTNLKTFSDEIADFYNSVKDTQDVTIIVQSEFWRTLKVNWSNWTDHWVWGWYFIVSNNSKFKQELPESIYWKMNLEKEKDNWLWVWIDFRSIYTKILNSLYSVSNNYFWEVYDFEDYLDENPPKINYLRSEFKRYSWTRPYADLKFSVEDKNFKLYDWSKVEVYYWFNLENLSKYSSYWTNKRVITSQWETETTYIDWDKFTLNFPIWRPSANSEYFYKVVAMDNQFNEVVFTWSFITPKVIDNTSLNKFETENSSILRKYNDTTITWSTIIPDWWIILAEAWTWWILFWTWSDWIQMKAFSWTTKITNLNFVWSNDWDQNATETIWNWWFLLPKNVEKDLFLPDYAESNWENLSSLEIPKIIKVWADTLWVWMDLDREVEITIPWIPTWKNYWIISSEDWKNWSPVNTEVALTWSWDLTFKTNHFSYFAPVVWNIVSCDLTLNSNENTAWWNVSFQFSSENSTNVKLENWDWENIFISWKNWAKTITLSDTSTWEIVYNFTVSNAISEKTCSQNLEILPVEKDLENWEILSSTWELVTFTWTLVDWLAQTWITIKEVFEKFWENENYPDEVKNFSATWNFLTFLNKKILNSSWKELVWVKIWTWTKIFSPRVFNWKFKKEKISSISDENFTEWWVKKIRKFKNPIKIWWDKTLILDNYATLTFKWVWSDTSKFAFRKDEDSEWTFKDIEDSECEPVFPGECAYHSWEDVILKTYHFTEFAIIEDEIVKDDCPEWDYTWSDTDWSCWTAPVTWGWSSWWSSSWWSSWWSSSSWWWGWGWWSFWPTVWNFTISATSKKDFKTFDNIDLKKIEDWIIPVEIKMEYLTWKYSVLISEWTKITTENWEIFNWKLLAPERLSNTKVPKINWAIVALRALEIWAENEKLKFSKNIKIEFSTAWLSQKINRKNILIYSWNEENEKYFLESTNIEVDEENENISFETNHATKFILTNWPIYLESWNEFINPNIISKTRFSDIKNHWAKNYIENLTEKNIFKNWESFRPNDNLTRAELSKILTEAFWLEEKIILDEKNFFDVQKNSWYEKYVKTIYTNKIANWYSDWTFWPWKSINRAEAVKMILKVLEEKWKISAYKNIQNNFSDINWNDWYFDYVNKWKEIWIINWYSDWKFWPWNNVTRAEISKIISKSLDL